MDIRTFLKDVADEPSGRIDTTLLQVTFRGNDGEYRYAAGRYAWQTFPQGKVLGIWPAKFRAQSGQPVYVVEMDLGDEDV